MLNRRITAALVTASLSLTLCGVTALAVSQEGSDASAASDSSAVQTQGEPPAQTAAPAGDSSAQPEETASAPQPAESAAGEQPQEPEEVYTPDAVGTLSFANVGRRVRENNLTALSLNESIQMLKSKDFDQMKDDLKDGLNSIARAQYFYMTSVPGLGSIMSSNLESSYNSLKDTFDDLKDGKIQEDVDAAIRQLENAQDQLVMGAESTYIALVSGEQNLTTLERGLTTLERNIKEVSLRYDLGQVSALTLEQLKGQKTSLLSSRQSVVTSIENGKSSLELLVGADVTGKVKLQPLPQVSDKELAAMNLENDLAAAKEASYSLFAAQRTLNDAKDDYHDTAKSHDYNADHYEVIGAKHSLEAAKYTYNATVQSFESSFRILFNKVKDDKQVLDAAKTALSVQKDTYASMELKYKQGTLSENKLADAKDEVTAAQEAITTAQTNLFSDYNTYRWAVDHGILN